MNNDQLIAKLADDARKAAQSLRHSSYQERQKALLAIANAIENNQEVILRSNKIDMDRERAGGMSESLLDRLALNPSRIAGIAGGARKVAALEDPLRKIVRERTLENGLALKQMTVPFGVVGMVYEARPTSRLTLRSYS